MEIGGFASWNCIVQLCQLWTPDSLGIEQTEVRLQLQLDGPYPVVVTKTYLVASSGPSTCPQVGSKIPRLEDTRGILVGKGHDKQQQHGCPEPLNPLPPRLLLLPLQKHQPRWRLRPRQQRRENVFFGCMFPV